MSVVLEINPEVEKIVSEVIGLEMKRFGFKAARIETGEDHDGDPVLLIDVTYSAAGAPIDPRIVAGLLTKLRNRLWAAGETRFPLIRHHFPKYRKVVGYR